MVSSIASPLYLNKQTVSIEPNSNRKHWTANRFFYSLVKHIKRHAHSFLLQLKQCANLESHWLPLFGFKKCKCLFFGELVHGAT